MVSFSSGDNQGTYYLRFGWDDNWRKVKIPKAFAELVRNNLVDLDH